MTDFADFKRQADKVIADQQEESKEPQDCLDNLQMLYKIKFLLRQTEQTHAEIKEKLRDNISAVKTEIN